MADAGVSLQFTGVSLKSHRGITKVHSGAARCKWHGVVNPIHAAFIKGLGYITPSQDHTPSLACKIIVENHWRLDGSLHQRVRATTMRLSWSGAGADDRWG